MIDRLNTLSEQYERVIAAPPTAQRREFGTYCRLVFDAVALGQITTQEGAYNICGTAARILDALSDSDRELMWLAGNVELPEAHRDTSLPDWEALKIRAMTSFPNN